MPLISKFTLDVLRGFVTFTRICLTCRSGEIGRRTGLKIPRWRHCVGSSPTFGTIFKSGQIRKDLVVQSCIFCGIIRGEIKSNIVLENEDVLVISDIAPKAPIHYLIIPKKHIESMAFLTYADKDICWAMCQVVQQLGKDLPDSAFNIIANNGASAGQSVFHMHWHLIAGKNIYASGFSL